MELETEIRACRDVLSNSDGQIVSALEGMLNCTSTTAITNYIKNIPNETKELLTYRASIREQMSAMQAALDGDPGEPEPMIDPVEPEPEAEPVDPGEPEPELVDPGDEEATPNDGDGE
jgi:hypothetical protein